MSKPLTPVARQVFEEEVLRGLQRATPELLPAISPETLSRLWVHYLELCRWNGRLSLVGPAAATDLLERHYGDSLAALSLLESPSVEPDRESPVVPTLDVAETQSPPLAGLRTSKGQCSNPARVLVDVGSGGGFPGIVLAAACPGLECVLVEAQERKWAFLKSVTLKASLPCRCLNARVSGSLAAGLPAKIDILTMRALRLPEAALAELVKRLTPQGRLVLWQTEIRNPAPALLSLGRVLHIRGSEHRKIVEFLRSPPSGVEGI